jgi:hypothetical protein
MSIFKLPILFVMLSLWIASSYASDNSVFQTENVPVVLTFKTEQSGDDRSSSIIASINGHYLTIAFTENLGEVSIEIQNASGVPLDISFMDTPSGRQFYIPSTGGYTLIIKLENGDEYHGEFVIED